MSDVTAPFMIENSIPVPNGERRAPSPSTLTAKMLGIGQSFFVPCDPTEASLVANRTYQLGIRTGKRFKYRTEPNGVRIWRLQ